MTGGGRGFNIEHPTSNAGCPSLTPPLGDSVAAVTDEHQDVGEGQGESDHKRRHVRALAPDLSRRGFDVAELGRRAGAHAAIVPAAPALLEMLFWFLASLSAGRLHCWPSVAEYLQNYNPTHSVLLSTLVAAAPVLTLLYLLALHPVRRGDGSIHLGIPAYWAAAVAAVVALLLAVWVFRMPALTAGMSLVYGAMFGLFPIGWIVASAMFLYTITLTNGTFEVVKDSVARLSDDRRVQAILIAFSFGAFVEGAAGFGTPVAISGALMVGLGFAPRQAAILCLIANTAPVAYGALGTPITALAKVTDIDPMLISKMAARQLPFFSLIVPVWMTAVQVRMDKRPWRDVWEVWPALLVAGGSFAVTQFVVGNWLNYQLVDIAGGVVSMAAVAGLMKVWRPRSQSAIGNRQSPIHPPPDPPLPITPSSHPPPSPVFM